MPSELSELIATVNAKVLDAIDADESGDVARALQLMEQASMALAVVPDGKIEDAEVAWDRSSIQNQINNLRRRVNRSAGVVTETVRYRRG